MFKRPPRLRLVNTRTGKTFKMQFNPSELEEAISVNYARQQVPGLGHEVLQFINTANRTFSMELFFENGNFNQKNENAPINPILIVRRFLRSLVYPRAVGGLINGGAPRVLMVAPKFISISCVVTDLTLTYPRFNIDGAPSAMVAALTIEEIRDITRLSEEVYAPGGKGILTE
jgi:hypothetical protein